MNINKIREDFTVLRNNPKMSYFDSACVSLKPDQVVEAMNQYYYEFPACVGRSMHKLGEAATYHIEKSRKLIAKYFNSKRDNQIIFTRNTSEGLNLLAKSLKLSKGATVLTTGKEHNSNLVPWLRLKELGKIKHSIIPLKEDNTTDINAYHELLEKGGVEVVSFQYGSNLDGTTNPLKEMVKLAHDYKAKVIVDAAQSAGHTEINVRKLDIDFLACSGHKMLGPSGIGVLYGKEDELNNLNSFMQGGDTVKETWYDKYTEEDLPEKFEAGLGNYAGMIGFGRAVQYLQKIGLNSIHKHEEQINKELTDIFSALPVKIIGPQDHKLRSGIISFYSEKMDNHAMSLLFNSQDIYTRSGAFCVHSWFNKYKVKGAVRFSSYLYNTMEEVGRVRDFVEKSLKPLL